MISFLKTRYIFSIIGILICLGSWLALYSPGLAQSGTPEWSRPIPVSGALRGSRFPSIVADDLGIVHIFWGFSQSGIGPTLFVSKYKDSVWSRPVDVLLGGPRSMGFLDGRDLVHLLLPQDGNVLLTYARTEDAISALGWNSGLTLNRPGGGELGDMLVETDGTINTVWFQKAPNCDKCLSIVFEQFSQTKDTGSTYRVLSESEESPQRNLQLVRAPSGTLFAAWDIPATNDRKAGIKLSISDDGGNTWSENPLPIAFADQDLRQPLLLADKDNKLVLVYKYGVRDEIYYSVSSDNGTTWTDPQPIPGLFANLIAPGDDYYASVADSNGITHLIAPGRASKSQKEPGLYHVTWDGKAWSNLQEIFHANTTVEYPAVALSNGNRLEVSFSTRDLNPVGGDIDATSQVWYTTAQTDAPAATRVPLPTFTPMPTATMTPQPTGTPAPTPTPTLAAAVVNPDAPDASDVNPQLPIIVALGLTITLLVVVASVNAFIRRRR